MSSISSRILRFFKAKPTLGSTSSSSGVDETEISVTKTVTDRFVGESSAPDVIPTMADMGSKADDDVVEMEESSLVDEGVPNDSSQSNASGSRVTEIKVSGDDISLVVEVQGSSATAAAAAAAAIVRDTGSDLVTSKENSSSTSEVRERNNEPHQKNLFEEHENGGKEFTAEVEGFPEMKKNDTVEDEKKEVGLQEEEMGDQEDHGFSVGDFVWGKIKDQHWWPGQIYNPSDASKFAAKYQQRNRLLIAFFGDRSYAWCYPSELKPFLENFERMLLQSKSKRLHSAVEESLDEIGRIVESEMTCSCVPMEAQIGLVTPLAVNPGIKGGVVVPDCGIHEFLITHFQPAKFLAVLKYIAQVVSPPSMLDLTVFRRQLSVFNRSRGCRQLPMYQLLPEDNDEHGVTSRNDFNGQTGDLNLSLPEEDWLSSPRIRGFGKNSKEKWPGISEDKLYQRKKQRTMVDIMANEMDVEPENFDSDAAEEETMGKKMSAASGKRKKKEVETDSYLAEDDADSGNSVSPSKKKKKKKTKISGSPSEMAEKKESNATSADVGDREENKSKSLTRERKKSKYLSPPYTNLSSGNKNWIFSSDSVTETPKVPKRSRVGEKMRIAMHQLSGSPPLVKCSSETFHTKPSEKSLSYRTPEPKKIVFKLPSDEMFYEFLTAALDPMYLKENRSSRSVKDFFTRYRSSLYLDGSNYKKYNDYIADQCDEKGKFLDQKNYSPGKDAHETDHPTSNDKSVIKGKDETLQSSNNEPKIIKKKDQKMSQSPSNEPNRIKKKDQKMLQSPSNEPKRIKKKDEKMSQSPSSEPKRIKKKDLKMSQIPNSEPNRIRREDEKMSQRPNSEPKRIETKDEKLSQGPNSEPKRIKRRYVKRLQSPNNEPKRNKRKDEKSQSPNSKPKRNKRKDENLQSKPKRIKRKDEKKSQGPNSEPENAAGTVDNQQNHSKEANGETSGTVLLLNFAAGVYLPTKDDLISVFGKFGPLKESETEVLQDSGCARVVYTKSSDAEAAFNSSEKTSPFGPPDKVSYRLRYLSITSKTSERNGSSSRQHLPGPSEHDKNSHNVLSTPMELEEDETPANQPTPHTPVGEASPLLFVRQKLQIMTSMLERSGDELSPDVKAKLECEIKGLLKKVTTRGGDSSSS